MFFLPLFDNNPTGRMPVISWLILAICILVFFWQTGLSAAAEYELFIGYGVVPALLFGHQSLPNEVAAVSPWLSIFTSMFLHGGWLHLGSNMLYLWIFSDNVEDAMGPVKFILFYALCGVGAAFSQSFIDPFSVTPMVGASGGIAGILGAYILLHPKAAVRVFMLILIFIRIISLPAWLVLGVWIAGQFVAAPAALSGDGGVAYFAHIGGFVTGMILIPFFKRADLPLFDRDKQTDKPDWSTQPISFSELKTEAAGRYSRAGRTKGRGGSVPSVRRRIKGPWDRS
ncbi:MAG: rhomboid family intramembrane serine protease [Candidatus Puniceispirillaceae bacterium]|nr:rhomboid family intramembrane serine protease [Alphaproteobacteria bacterium]